MISIIVLAAGSSSRMGQSKQLLDINNEALLQRSVKTALGSKASQVLVVLGNNAINHRKVIAHLPVDIVVNEDWQQGMGSSIKVGVERIHSESVRSTAVIIMVCDQPLLTVSHLDQMIATYKQTRKLIVASYYSGVEGVPALFDRAVITDLLKIENDQGAKVVFQSHRDSIVVVEFPGGEIDLDTWEDYENFMSR